MTRGYGERAWARPGAVLAAALRAAARGLPAKPPTELGSLRAGPPTARVVEVYAPAATSAASGGAARPDDGVLAIAGGAVAAALAAAAVGRTRRERRSAALAPPAGLRAS